MLRGWECEGCGINRNDANEVWRDCKCSDDVNVNDIESSNKEYWDRFWNKF